MTRADIDIWAIVRKRAWIETVSLLKLDGPGRVYQWAVISVGPSVVSVVYSIVKHEDFSSALYRVFALVGLTTFCGLTLYLVKLFSVTASLAAENLKLCKAAEEKLAEHARAAPRLSAELKRSPTRLGQEHVQHFLVLHNSGGPAAIKGSIHLPEEFNDPGVITKYPAPWTNAARDITLGIDDQEACALVSATRETLHFHVRTTSGEQEGITRDTLENPFGFTVRVEVRPVPHDVTGPGFFYDVAFLHSGKAREAFEFSAVLTAIPIRILS